MPEDTVDDALGESAEVPKGGWRHRMRSNPATRHPFRLGVFVFGLLFILLGIAFIALPGPLTIPPMLIGLWIWSSEFAWAERFFDSIKEKADDAWEHAKRRPVSSAIITGGGLVAAGVALWAVSHYELIDKAKDVV
jgi:fatty acid desaturase